MATDPEGPTQESPTQPGGGAEPVTAQVGGPEGPGAEPVTLVTPSDGGSESAPSEPVTAAAAQETEPEIAGVAAPEGAEPQGAEPPEPPSVESPEPGEEEARVEPVEASYIEISWTSPVEQLEELFGRPVGAQRPLETLAGLLAEDEEVLCGASGFRRGHYGLLAATSRRLLFVQGDRAVIDARFAEIDGFRALVGIWTADLKIETGARSELIKQIHPRRRLGELAGVLHSHHAGAA